MKLSAAILFISIPFLSACSPSIQSCLDDGITLEQVQDYLAQGKRQALINQFTIRAEHGEAAAQYFLGFLHWTDNPQKSFDWFKRSAENGCLESVIHVAQSYADGSGVEQDSQQAFQWYLKAAQAGDSSAMRMVSLMYRQGNGVAQDLEKARYWASQSW